MSVLDSIRPKDLESDVLVPLFHFVVPTDANRYQQVPTGTNRYPQVPTGTHRYPQVPTRKKIPFLPIFSNFETFSVISSYNNNMQLSPN